MAFDANVWSQLKALSDKDLQKALVKDGWTFEEERKGMCGYYKEFQLPGTSRDPKTNVLRQFRVEKRRVQIHPKSSKDYGPGLLKALIEDIGWSEEDLRRLKLIK